MDTVRALEAVEAPLALGDALVVAAPHRSPALAYLAGLAPSSRATQVRALDRIAEIATGGAESAASLPWETLTPGVTKALRAALAERYAPATANRHLAALRGVLREAWRLGLMGADAFQRAADVPDVRGSRLPAGRALGAGEVRALFEACARDANRAAGLRDAAALALLYGTGLRRAEAVGLELDAFDRETGELRVRGKGEKERLAHLVNGARRALEAWLAVRGDAQGALLTPTTKSGRVVVRRMTATALYLALGRRALEANVARFSPHDCRRTFVGDLLDAGADISTVQRLAGHADPRTTSRYDRRPEAAKRRAVELLHVPFAG